jgi:malonyl-CoA O-methyltransferase
MGERLDYIRIEPRRILDLGCGPGADLPAFAERYPGVPRIAIDSAPAMLAQARGDTGLLKRLLRFGKPAEPDFICADATALPLARAAYRSPGPTSCSSGCTTRCRRSRRSTGCSKSAAC